MNAKRSKPQLSAKLRTGVTSNQIRSHCKLCPEPVLVGQPAELIPDPAGLSHTACIELRRKQLAATAAGGGCS